MKRGNFYKILDFAKIPVILTGVFLVLKWGKENFSDTGLNKPLPTVPRKRSKNIAEIAMIADIQQTAMASIGTDETTLFNSLEGLNSEDLKELYNSFGKRNYAYFGKGGSFIGELLSLPEWYQKELSGNDLTEMKNIWKDVITF